MNLALNPHLAQIDLIELRLVQAKMARLHKALDILQERDKDDDKAWQELHQEMVQQDHEIDWQVFLFATAGLGEALKVVSADNVRKAEAIQKETVWGELGIAKTNLQKMLASAHGQDAEELRKSIAAAELVERARQAHDNVERGNQLRDAMVVETEALRRISAADPRTVDALYEFSTVMGRTAMVFGKGIVGKSNAAASLAEPFAEASALYLMMLQEEKQFDQLSGNFADRQTKRRQIHEQLGDLENRQRYLQWAIRRADPCVRL